MNLTPAALDAAATALLQHWRELGLPGIDNNFTPRDAREDAEVALRAALATYPDRREDW